MSRLFISLRPARHPVQLSDVVARLFSKRQEYRLLEKSISTTMSSAAVVTAATRTSPNDNG